MTKLLIAIHSEGICWIVFCFQIIHSDFLIMITATLPCSAAYCQLEIKLVKCIGVGVNPSASSLELTAQASEVSFWIKTPRLILIKFNVSFKCIAFQKYTNRNNMEFYSFRRKLIIIPHFLHKFHMDAKLSVWTIIKKVVKKPVVQIRSHSMYIRITL